MTISSLSDSQKKLQAIIRDSARAVCFTGAGISTESGVSDYRSKGGLWQQFQPVTIQEFVSDPEKRKEYWNEKKEAYGQMRAAKPNPGHLSIARLEAEGKLTGVITQNIDGLHQLAGSRNVLELHGTNREIICLNCRETGPFDPIFERILRGEDEFLCSKCGGLLKPNTISFGQSLDPDVLMKAVEWAKHCDLLLALGSTLIVEPAASLPRLAKESGAKLVIINRDPTPLDKMADLVIHDAIGAGLARVCFQKAV